MPILRDFIKPWYYQIRSPTNWPATTVFVHFLYWPNINFMLPFHSNAVSKRLKHKENSHAAVLSAYSTMEPFSIYLDSSDTTHSKQQCPTAIMQVKVPLCQKGDRYPLILYKLIKQKDRWNGVRGRKGKRAECVPRPTVSKQPLYIQGTYCSSSWGCQNLSWLLNTSNKSYPFVAISKIILTR